MDNNTVFEELQELKAEVERLRKDHDRLDVYVMQLTQAHSALQTHYLNMLDWFSSRYKAKKTGEL